MKKIPTLFKRNPDDMKHVLPEVNPGCEWVLAGEGKPTRKFDGTCMKFEVDGIWDAPGTWWARREVKPNQHPPRDFVLADEDPITGKAVGWVPAGDSPFAKFWQEALDYQGDDFAEGTYELIGPKINGNPEGIDHHFLVPHGAVELNLHFTGGQVGAYDFFESVLTDEKFKYEGIVWHHPDGRMAKLKKRDFT